MKSFFEEYGFVILAAIIVILLIVMATPVGDLIKIQIDNTINSFGSKTQSKLNATDGVINVRVSTVNNKITLEWDAVKKEDKFKYQYKASSTSKDANWTDIKPVDDESEKSRKVEIVTDSKDQPLTNKTKVEYKIYDSNDQLVASGVVTAKIGKDATTGGEGGTGGDSGGGSTENPSAPTITLTAGQKIIIADKEYTVIENVEGNQYKVLATDRFKKPFDASSNEYVKSEIANYLDNDYFNTLPESIRNAIVETAIQQKVLKTWNSNSSTDWDTPRNAGKHKVFLPSWDEVKTAAGSANKTALRKLLNSDTVWLRDTYDSNVLNVLGMGYLNHNDPNINSVCVRPAFVLDLSNVDYTKK